MTNNNHDCDAINAIEEIQADLNLLAIYRKSGSRELPTVNDLQQIEERNISRMKATLGTVQEANQLFEQAERETEIVLSAQEINGCDKLRALAKAEVRIHRCFQIWLYSMCASDTLKTPEKLLGAALPLVIAGNDAENHWESLVPERA